MEALMWFRKNDWKIDYKSATIDMKDWSAHTSWPVYVGQILWTRVVFQSTGSSRLYRLGVSHDETPRSRETSACSYSLHIIRLKLSFWFLLLRPWWVTANVAEGGWVVEGSWEVRDTSVSVTRERVHGEIIIRFSATLEHVFFINFPYWPQEVHL